MIIYKLELVYVVVNKLINMSSCCGNIIGDIIYVCQSFIWNKILEWYVEFDQELEKFSGLCFN